MTENRLWTGILYESSDMMDTESILSNLRKRRYRAFYTESGEAAAEMLATQLAGKTVGFGGSVTVKQLGLYEKLSASNQVYWHWLSDDRTAAQEKAARAQVYILSANAMTEAGEIVNIDGNGNRLSSMLYGHERVIFLVGINKLTPDLQSAIDRARNIASPLNARRLKRKTPCALTEPMRCHDCVSPERICNGMTILFEKMGSIPEMDVILIGESLGF